MVLLVVRSMRPYQWTKNLFLFAGLIFSQNLLHGPLILRTVLAFCTFCLLTGGVYIINDVIDKKEDRLHPSKKNRPIASGRVSVAWALATALCSIIVSLLLSFRLSVDFGVIAAIYVILMTGYSLLLKRVVILDVLIISAGFILRVVAGTVLIGVTISSWLLTCTIFLSLCLALGKRRCELSLVHSGSEGHRDVLQRYSLPFLDQLIAVVTASTLLSYALYTMSEATVEKFGSEKLIFTIPFVVYGLFRYLYLIYVKSEGGDPGKDLFTDRGLLLDVILWVCVAGVLLYV